MVDVDGVISLFGPFPRREGSSPAVEGSFHSIEGIPHFLSSTAATHLLALAELFELVWCSGWEERADEHLPYLLGLPPRLPFLRFAHGVRDRREGNAHWKLEAIDAYAGDRALAWVDDSLDETCHAWAEARRGATLLVETSPEAGLTEGEARRLESWARSLPAG